MESPGSLFSDLDRLRSHPVVKEALESGEDLRDRLRQQAELLYAKEEEYIERVIARIDDTVLLERESGEMSKHLRAMQARLHSFQKSISGMTDSVTDIQAQSTTLRTKIQNRQDTVIPLCDTLHPLILSPSLIRTIACAPVDSVVYASACDKVIDALLALQDWTRPESEVDESSSTDTDSEHKGERSVRSRGMSAPHTPRVSMPNTPTPLSRSRTGSVGAAPSDSQTERERERERERIERERENGIIDEITPLVLRLREVAIMRIVDLFTKTIARLKTRNRVRHLQQEIVAMAPLYDALYRLDRTKAETVRTGYMHTMTAHYTRHLSGYVSTVTGKYRDCLPCGIGGCSQLGHVPCASPPDLLAEVVARGGGGGKGGPDIEPEPTQRVVGPSFVRVVQTQCPHLRASLDPYSEGKVQEEDPEGKERKKRSIFGGRDDGSDDLSPIAPAYIQACPFSAELGDRYNILVQLNKKARRERERESAQRQPGSGVADTAKVVIDNSCVLPPLALASVKAVQDSTQAASSNWPK
ncbi:vacuolar protein sorting related protein, partial [Kipferlia bialata]|eukprot:g9326.t1